MFDMILAVIVPSLGISMLIIMSSLIGLTINLTILIIVVFLMAFVQFMFLSIIKSSRPAVGASD